MADNCNSDGDTDKKRKINESEDQHYRSSICFRIVDQNKNERHYRLNRTTKLGKVFDDYCESQGFVKDSVKFFYDGNRVRRSLNPAELNMEDGAEIEAYTEVGGGGPSPSLLLPCPRRWGLK